MKIPRVKIYLKFRIFLKSIFSSLEISKKELSDYLNSLDMFTDEVKDLRI